MKRHWKVQINLNGLSNTSKAWQGCMSNKKERKNTIKFQLHTNKNKLNVGDKTKYQFQEKWNMSYVCVTVNASEKRENYLINARIA